MRSTLLFSWAALTASAIAGDAYLWTIDHGAAKYANTQASSTSPETASSIIGRRRGFLKDRDILTTNEAALKDIYQYGGYQVPEFGTTTDPTPARVFIRISGYTGSISNFPSLPDLWIEDATKPLATDFKARKGIEDACEYDLSIPMKNGVDIVYSYDPEGSSCKSAQEIQMQPSILVLLSSVPTAKDVAKSLGGLLRALSHLSVTGNVESTLLVLPPNSKLRGNRLELRADPSEELLELKAQASASATATTTAARPSKSTNPLPQIIPQCFASQESCDDTTNSCSGHGSCYKAHNNCYKCKCGTTVVRENPDGTRKTVQWGGNACQKKDVSTEFFLFASIGVVILTLISGAIGAMYTMGSQELPSVLGAGVAGSKQK